MKKILFPTDFSETSLNAFVYALKLAKSTDAEVITLNVYNLPIIESGFSDVPMYQAEVYQSLELSNFENYKDQIPKLRQIADEHQLGHIPISHVLLDGDVVENIRQLVEKDHIDYVVMGTSGASGLNEFFFGSVTSEIMTKTSAMVLGVPAGSHYEGIHKIGFATQYSIKELDALRKLLPLARKLKASIECVYVQTPDNEVNEVIINDWKTIFKGEAVTFHTIQSKDVEDMLMDFINLYRIDVFALLNEKRGFWEGLFHSSLTKKLAHHLKVPLLVMHDS